MRNKNIIIEERSVCFFVIVNPSQEAAPKQADSTRFQSLFSFWKLKKDYDSKKG